MANDNVLDNDLGLVSDDTLREGLIGKDSQDNPEAYLKQISDKLTGVIDQSQQIGQLSTKVTTLENTVGDSSTGLVKNVSDLDSDINNQSTGLKVEVSALGDRVDTLEDTVNNQNTGVSALNSKVNDLSSDVTNLESSKQNKLVVNDPLVLEHDETTGNDVLSFNTDATFDEYHTHSSDDIYVPIVIHGGAVNSTVGNLNKVFRDALANDQSLKDEYARYGLQIDVPEEVVNINIIDDNFSSTQYEGTYALVVLNMNFLGIRSRLLDPESSWYDIKYGALYKTDNQGDYQTRISDSTVDPTIKNIKLKFDKYGQDKLEVFNPTSYYDFIHLIDNPKEIKGEVADRIIGTYGDKISVLTMHVYDENGQPIVVDSGDKLEDIASSTLTIAICMRTDTRVPNGLTFEEYFLGESVVIGFEELNSRYVEGTPLMDYLENDLQIKSSNVRVALTNKGGELVNNMAQLPLSLYDACITNPTVMEELESDYNVDPEDPSTIVDYDNTFSGIVEIDGTKYLHLYLMIPRIALKERLYPNTDTYYGYLYSELGVGDEIHQVSIVNKLEEALTEVHLDSESDIESIMNSLMDPTQEDIEEYLNKYLVLSVDAGVGERSYCIIALLTNIDQSETSINYDDVTFAFPEIEPPVVVDTSADNYFAKKSKVDSLQSQVDSIDSSISDQIDDKVNPVINRVDSIEDDVEVLQAQTPDQNNYVGGSAIVGYSSSSNEHDITDLSNYLLPFTDFVRHTTGSVIPITSTVSRLCYCWSIKAYSQRFYPDGVTVGEDVYHNIKYGRRVFTYSGDHSILGTSNDAPRITGYDDPIIGPEEYTDNYWKGLVVGNGFTLYTGTDFIDYIGVYGLLTDRSSGEVVDPFPSTLTQDQTDYLANISDTYLVFSDENYTWLIAYVTSGTNFSVTLGESSTPYYVDNKIPDYVSKTALVSGVNNIPFVKKLGSTESPGSGDVGKGARYFESVSDVLKKIAI